MEKKENAYKFKLKNRAALFHEDDARHDYLILNHFPNYSRHFISYIGKQGSLIT